MLEYDRIDLSQEIDVCKTIGLREGIICHCWYFLGIKFKYHRKVCDGCYDLMQKAMNFDDVY